MPSRRTPVTCSSPSTQHGATGEQELYFIHVGEALATLGGDQVTVPAGSAVMVDGPTPRKFEATGLADDADRHRRDTGQGVRGRRLGEVTFDGTAGVAELADAAGLGPVGPQGP